MSMGFERFGDELSERELLEAGIEREHIGRLEETDVPENGEFDLTIESLETARPAWTGDLWQDDLTCGCTELLWVGETRESGMLIACEQGFFQVECGVSLDDFYALCVSQGMEVELVRDVGFSDLMDMFREYDGVLCPVNGAMLESPGLADWPGLAADRLVAVSRVELDDPVSPRITLVDARTGDAGLTVSLDTFLDAWRAGGGTAVGLSRRGAKA